MRVGRGRLAVRPVLNPSAVEIALPRQHVRLHARRAPIRHAAAAALRGSTPRSGKLGRVRHGRGRLCLARNTAAAGRSGRPSLRRSPRGQAATRRTWQAKSVAQAGPQGSSRGGARRACRRVTRRACGAQRARSCSCCTSRSSRPPTTAEGGRLVRLEAHPPARAAPLYRHKRLPAGPEPVAHAARRERSRFVVEKTSSFAASRCRPCSREQTLHCAVAQRCGPRC